MGRGQAQPQRRGGLSHGAVPWINNIYRGEPYKAANTPLNVQLLLGNYMEGSDSERPQPDIILRSANGGDAEAAKCGRGLPTTEAWANWFNRVCKDESFIASMAATNIGTESQSPMPYSKALPALRDVHHFDEADIEHFWLHPEVDPRTSEMAIHYEPC